MSNLLWCNCTKAWVEAGNNNLGQQCARDRAVGFPKSSTLSRQVPAAFPIKTTEVVAANEAQNANRVPPDMTRVTHTFR